MGAFDILQTGLQIPSFLAQFSVMADSIRLRDEWKARTKPHEYAKRGWALRDDPGAFAAFKSNFRRTGVNEFLNNKPRVSYSGIMNKDPFGEGPKAGTYRDMLGKRADTTTGLKQQISQG